jgi:DNA-directed RNA polymerase specialized sigma24 family protein
MSESNSLNATWRGLTFQEWRRILDEGLGTLNERQRKILELTCFQGLLLSEIADRTKESLANVRHHYYRGLEGLRKFMEVTPRSDDEPRNHNKEGKNDE